MPHPGPLVSVLVPAYQHAAFIDEALESIVGQNYPRLEIVVADDASTDGTQDRVQRWAERDERIVPLLASSNSGLSSTWNRGLARCAGEFVAVLSSCFCPSLRKEF